MSLEEPKTAQPLLSVQVGPILYEVDFHHYPAPRHTQKGELPGTDCIITISPQGRPAFIVSGQSVVKGADTFSRREGRKKSLAAAFRESTVDYPDRKAIWEALWAKTGIK